MQDEAGKLIELEPLVAKKRTIIPKKHGFQLGGPDPERRWAVKGNKSPIRLKQGQKMLFVVRLAKGTDPSTFRLLVLENDKRYRWAASIPHDKTVSETLPVNVTKYGTSSYGLTPASDLIAGEYAFSARQSEEFYCFGVGEVQSDKHR